MLKPSYLPATPENDISLTKRHNELRGIAVRLPANAPELPEAEADIVYEKLLEAEREFASPDLSIGSYGNGTASHPDELKALRGEGDSVLTAEHGTTVNRNGKINNGEEGTTALTTVVARETGHSALLALGMQTGDPNYDLDSKFKNELASIIDSEKKKRHLSIHGMNIGKLTSLDDKRAIDVLLGVGDVPNEATVRQAEMMRKAGNDLGLRTEINAGYYIFSNGVPIRTDEGEYEIGYYKAASEGTTRRFSERYSQDSISDFVAIQVELSKLLRLKAPDREARLYQDGSVDIKRVKMATYLGYLFIRQVADIDLPKTTI